MCYVLDVSSYILWQSPNEGQERGSGGPFLASLTANISKTVKSQHHMSISSTAAF